MFIVCLKFLNEKSSKLFINMKLFYKFILFVQIINKQLPLSAKY